MVEAGITEIGIVVGETGAEIMAAVGDGSRWGVEVTYIPQDAPARPGPLRADRPRLPRRRRLRHVPRRQHAPAGPGRVRRALRGRPRTRPRPHPATATRRRPRPRSCWPRSPTRSQFGVAELDADGEVVRLVEKPEPTRRPTWRSSASTCSTAASTRRWRPSSRRARGELEITDAIQWLIDHGHRVRHEVLDGWWIDTGKKDPLLECNRLVLETLEARDRRHRRRRRRPSRAGSWSRPGPRSSTAAVRGPAIIGAGTRIVNSYIGPFTSIAADCEIIDSEIEHSVVLERSRIVDIPRLTDSLIGREVEVTRSARRPRAPRLMLGDHSRRRPASEGDLMATIDPVRRHRRRRHRRARQSTATSGASSSRPTGAQWFPGGREMIQGNRGDRQRRLPSSGLHYHLHQADYWYVPYGTARVVLHDLRDGLAHRRHHPDARPRRAPTAAPTTTAASTSRPAWPTASPRSPT